MFSFKVGVNANPTHPPPLPPAPPDLTMICANEPQLPELPVGIEMGCSTRGFLFCCIRTEENGGRNLDNDHSGVRAKSFLPICLLDHWNVSGRQDRDDDECAAAEVSAK